MKLWIGGILHDSVSEDFRHIRNATENTVNASIEGEDYGVGITTWDVVLIILESNHPKEHTRVSKASRETDVRLVIDYPTFLGGSIQQKEELLYMALLESIKRLSQKRITDFDSNRLQNDVMKALGLCPSA